MISMDRPNGRAIFVAIIFSECQLPLIVGVMDDDLDLSITIQNMIACIYYCRSQYPALLNNQVKTSCESWLALQLAHAGVPFRSVVVLPAEAAPRRLKLS